LAATPFADGDLAWLRSAIADRPELAPGGARGGASTSQMEFSFQ
jgi:hypothetical protein